MESARIFVDTNIFLHYQPIEDIPWKDVVDAEEAVICIAPIVIEELDDKKDSHRLSKIRERARKALQLIENSVGRDDFQVREGVGIQCMEEPDISFSGHGLRSDKPDDNLIASVLSLDPETRETAVLITGDTGPRIKAGRLDLQCMSLPEEYKAESALSEVEKENRRLQKKIDRLENRLPELDFVFKGGEKHCEFQVSEYAPLTEEEIDTKVEEIREQYPKKEYQPMQKPENAETVGEILKSAEASMAPLSRPSEQQIERYNDRLDDFYEEYREYLETQEVIKDVRGRMITLDIIITNTGSAPAEDIDVFMRFPDGFKLFSDENLPEMDIDEPQPPKEPKGGFPNIGAGLAGMTDPARHIQAPTVTPPGNVSSPNIEETNSYDVDFSVRKLKHNMRESCGPFYVVFDSVEDASSFSIDYRINTADLPDDTEGKLHVVV